VGLDKNFKVITAYVEHHGEVIAGEIGLGYPKGINTQIEVIERVRFARYNS